MGEHICFRPRARGCATKGISVAGVSHIEPRVKFIKGYLKGTPDPGDGSVECGPETDYPALATIRQIHEIFYGVREAYFSGGEIVTTVDASVSAYDIASRIAPNAFTPGSTLVETSGVIPASNSVTTYRGYSLGSVAGLSADVLTRFSPVYGPSSSQIDTLDFESNMWLQKFYTDYTVTTGFSLYQYSNDYSGSISCLLAEGGSGPDGSITYTVKGQAEAVLYFSGYVAWIDTTGSGDPYDVGNQKYVGCVFRASYKAPTTAPGFFYFIEDTVASVRTPYDPFDLFNNNPVPPAAPTLYLSLSMKSGNVNIPLMSTIDGSTPGHYPTAAGHLTLSANRWWPYKKQDGSPAWDSSDGSKL